MESRAIDADNDVFDVADVEPFVGDVTDRPEVQRATAGAALVVHCAAVISGTPEAMMRVNADGTIVLLGYLRCRMLVAPVNLEPSIGPSDCRTDLVSRVADF